MKHGRKRLARVQARQKAWDERFKGRDGFKRPGSMKKPFPIGKGR